MRSFEKYKGNKQFRYIVVENSNNTSYKDKILSLADEVTWVQNPTHHINSEANAVAIEVGLPFVTTEYVFICHNDVVACQENWMDFLLDNMKKLDAPAGAYVLDNSRINALHISGVLVKTDIAKKVDMYPVYNEGEQLLDVGDSITQYIRDNNLNYFYCRNTHNNESYIDLCSDIYKSLQFVDRALDDDNNVIFLHLGRGSLKTLGTYWKANRATLDDWGEFVENNILV